MKLAIALIGSVIALSACTATPQMIEAQKSRCTQLGYAQGTLEHAQCADRGTMQQQGVQNAAMGVAVEGAMLAAILNNM